MKDELFDLLCACLEGEGYDLEAIKADLGPHDKLVDFQIDSLDIVEFYVRIQERYGIKIAQDDFASLSSMSAIEKYLASKLALQTSA